MCLRHKNKQTSPSKLRLDTFRLKGKLGFLLKLKQGSLLIDECQYRGDSPVRGNVRISGQKGSRLPEEKRRRSLLRLGGILLYFRH